MFSVRFRNPSYVLCLGNEPSTWVMCYRLERFEEAHGSSIPPESERNLAPHKSEARILQATFGTVTGGA